MVSTTWPSPKPAHRASLCPKWKINRRTKSEVTFASPWFFPHCSKLFTEFLDSPYQPVVGFHSTLTKLNYESTCATAPDNIVISAKRVQCSLGQKKIWKKVSMRKRNEKWKAKKFFYKQQKEVLSPFWSSHFSRTLLFSSWNSIVTDHSPRIRWSFSKKLVKVRGNQFYEYKYKTSNNWN